MNRIQQADNLKDPNATEVDGIVLNGPFESLIFDSMTIRDEDGTERQAYTIRLQDNTLAEDEQGDVIGILTDEAAFHRVLKWFTQAAPAAGYADPRDVVAAASRLLAHRHRHRSAQLH